MEALELKNYLELLEGAGEGICEKYGHHSSLSLSNYAAITCGNPQAPPHGPSYDCLLSICQSLITQFMLIELTSIYGNFSIRFPFFVVFCSVLCPSLRLSVSY